MPWTPPSTPMFVSGQVMTATIMNQLADDLRYLKGTDGAVTIDSVVTVPGFVSLRNDTNYQFRCERSIAVARSYGFAVSSTDGNFAMDDITAAARRWTMDTVGNFAINTGAVRGQFQVVAAGGGFLELSASGVGGSVVTMAPAGTVGYMASLWGGIRNAGGGAGTVAGSTLFLSQAFGVASGADTVTLGVSAAGAIYAQRTAGANLHNVNLFVVYI